MNTHEKISELLISFVLGELSEKEKSQVKAHVAECAECSSELKRLQALLECTDQMKELSADNQLCETAKESLLTAIGSQEKQLSPNTNINLTFGWRTIMQSRITKLVAAVVIIIAAGIGIAVFSNLDYNTIVKKPTEDPEAELKAELEQIEKLFIARDVRGLETMLLNAKFDESKVLAANYLAQIGDPNSVAVLQQVNDEYGGTEPAFADAIAAIETRTAEADAEGTEGAPSVDVNTVVVAAANAPTEQAPDELLQLVPAESMFCVRVNNFDYVFGMIDQYLAGISPMPAGATMFARMQLVGALGDPALNGVNTAGSFAIFGLSSAESEANPMGSLFIATLVPVTDYEKFVSDNPNCEQPDANGISIIKTGGTLNPDKKMLAAKLGGYALISSANNYNKLLSIAKSVSQGVSGLGDSLDAGELAAATNQPLWAYGNVQRAATVFGPMVYAQLEQMKKQLETMNANSQGGPSPAAVMNMYFGMFNILTEEVEFLSVSVNPKADVLNLTISAGAVPNTLMAKMFVADTSDAANTLLRYLKDGAILNLGFKMNTPFMEELSMTEYDFIAFLSDQNIPDETIDKFENLVADMVSCAAGPGIASFTYNSEGWPPFAGKYVIAVKDEQKWNQLIKAGADLYNTGEFADLQNKMGIEYRYEIKTGADDCNGVSIDVGKLVMEPNDPNSMYGKMMDKIYGGGFEFSSAMVDGLWLCVFSADCNSAIRELIDEVKAGGPKEMAPEMTSALALLKDAGKAEFVGTLNLVRYMRMAIHFLQQTNPMGVSLPQIDVSTNSNLAFAGRVSNGKMAVEIALPKQHMLETKAAGEMMGQMFMLMAARQEAISQIPSTGPIIGEPQPGMPTLYTVVPDVNLSDEQTLIEGLRTFAEISNGRYPGNLNLIMALKESGEALRKSILEDQNRDPDATLPTREEIMAKLANIEAACLFYAKLVKEGKDVIYRGDKVTTEFPHVILMQWKISEDRHRVIFADLTGETVTAERLAELEAVPLNLAPKAIKPQPQDGAVAVPVEFLELSWLPGFNAAEHRIYLGTSPDELSLLGGLTSPLTKPQPQDGAVAVPVVEVELSSMPGFNAAEHRIHLGTSHDELSLLGGLTSPFTDRVLYVTSGKLQVDTTYYWRVDEVGADGSVVTGDVWSFTTGKLIGWWKFDEGSGSVAVDSSGNGNNGTLNNMDANDWVDGIVGSALDFDGEDDYIDVDYIGDFEAMTISMLVNVGSLPHAYNALLHCNGWSSRNVHFIILEDGHVRFAVNGSRIQHDPESAKHRPRPMGWDQDSDYAFTSDAFGQWHHIAAAYDSKAKMVDFYIDGKLDVRRSYESAPTLTVGPLRIAGWDRPGRNFEGRIDDIRIYNYALSEDEVAQIYNSTNPALME